MKGFFWGIAITIIVILGGGFAVIATGLPDVSATGKEPGWQEWILKTTRDHSIERRAEGVTVPDDLDRDERLAVGAAHYQEMCIGCHGAPGHEPGEAAAGLNPQPPELVEAMAEEQSDSELFWVVKHGIRMTGMPGFGPTHDDEKIWDLVAFIEKLPDLDAKSYHSWVERGEAMEDEHGEEREHGGEAEEHGSEESGSGTEGHHH